MVERLDTGNSQGETAASVPMREYKGESGVRGGTSFVTGTDIPPFGGTSRRMIIAPDLPTPAEQQIRQQTDALASHAGGSGDMYGLLGMDVGPTNAEIPAKPSSSGRE